MLLRSDQVSFLGVIKFLLLIIIPRVVCVCVFKIFSRVIVIVP